MENIENAKVLCDQHSSDLDEAMKFISLDKGWISPSPEQIMARYNLDDDAFQIRYVHTHTKVARVDVFDSQANLQSRHYYSAVEDMLLDLSHNREKLLKEIVESSL